MMFPLLKDKNSHVKKMKLKQKWNNIVRREQQGQAS